MSSIDEASGADPCHATPAATDLGPELVACPRCARQWDCAGIPRGERLRCACGEVFAPEVRAPRAPRVFRCGNCGAALPAEGRSCGYCTAEITLEERGLSGVCPGCSSRLLRGARFCMECGLSIQPQRLAALREGVSCPRCSGALRSRELGESGAIECASCAGLWLAPEAFERLCERAETEDLAAFALGARSPSQSVARARREGYIPCVTCNEPMLRKNFGQSSGVVLDSCKRHGVWFDHRELERVLEFVKRGGLLEARKREIARLEDEARRAAARAEGGASPVLFEPERDFRTGRRGDVDLLDVLVWIGKTFATSARRR